MKPKKPKPGTIEWFDSLSSRDFENGAVLEEIANVFAQRDELLAACKAMLKHDVANLGIPDAEFFSCYTYSGGYLPACVRAAKRAVAAANPEEL